MLLGWEGDGVEEGGEGGREPDEAISKRSGVK